ncbi:MAG: oxidoreductase [Bacteroidota bacterium]|nr:oxidoreductase [Bacteroidota bacterium]MDX5427861.1 oxidoreductase [Bacteroidota bacterium]MDX5448406.1 oxidoreductase [Bacteroidota bacterium]MDX5505737.1 oxidoreductase [Bacteroidota bacterium]
MKKVILVTGASSGIGKATALKLLKDGHIVYGAARRIEKMKDIEDAGGTALEMDVLKEDQMQAAVDRIISENQRIDVLFNNAGYAIYGAVEDTTIEDARRQFEVNIFGLARMTQLVLPQMRKQRSGTIINTSSMGGKIYTPLGAWYHATKHALEGWSDCLRIELKPFGIDVVIIEPGIILTEFGDVMTQPITERSGQGPYKGLAESIIKATQEAYKDPKGSSPPSVIANEVSKAVAAKRPKTRYAAGKFAKLMITLRKWLTDRMFDSIVMSQVR